MAATDFDIKRIKDEACTGVVLRSAAWRCRQEAVLEILERCGDIINAADVAWALRDAANKGHLEVTRELIVRCGDRIGADDAAWALRDAADKGHLEVARVLYERYGSVIGEDTRAEILDRWPELAQYDDLGPKSAAKLS